MNRIIDWLAHPTRHMLKISHVGQKRTPQAFELFGRRWHVGVALQPAGAPVIDGASTTNYDGFDTTEMIWPAGRRYGGVAIKLRPTLGRCLVIGRRDRPIPAGLGARRPRILFAPRPNGWLPPPPYVRLYPPDEAEAFAAWEADHQDSIND